MIRGGPYITLDAPTGIGGSLATLSDVNLSGVQDDDSLRYNLSAGMWENDSRTFVRPEWYGAKGDGTTDDTAAIRAAITAGAAAKLPVVLSGTYVFTATLSLPQYTILRGVNAGGSTTLGYGAVLIFNPSSAIPAIQTNPGGSYCNSIELDNFHLKTDGILAYPTIGIDFNGVLGGKISGVGIAGPFSVAGLVVDGPLDCQLDKIDIGNTNATQAMASGILFTGTSWVGTTTTILDIYIHGLLGSAVGGITDGIVVEGDYDIVFLKPIVETISRYACNIHKGSRVDIYSPYVENCPNIDGAIPIIRVAKDDLGATPTTIVNICGGNLGGPNSGYSLAYGFQVGEAYLVNVAGTTLERVGHILESDAWYGGGAGPKISFRGITDNNGSSYFGTVGDPDALYWDQSNRVGYPPLAHAGLGTGGNVPIYYKSPGMQYFATDYGTRGGPIWWNGTEWVDVYGQSVTLTSYLNPSVAAFTIGDETVGELWGTSITLGNTLINASFELPTGDDGNPPSWYRSNCDCATVVGGESGYCVQITRNAANFQWILQGASGLVVGRTYSVSAYVKSGTSGNETYKIYVSDCGGGSYGSPLITGTTSGSWVQVTNTFVATGTTGNFILMKDSATPGTMLFDEANCHGITSGNADVVGVYKVAGTQVVGAQGAAVADASAVSGTATSGGYGFVSSTEMNNFISGVNALKDQFNTLLSRDRAHGLIAT